MISPKGIIPVNTTFLSDVEALSEEELAQASREWKKNRLERVIFSMIMDKEFARDICEWIAANDSLHEMILELRKRKKRRRPTKWTDARHIVLLQEYASRLRFVEQGLEKYESIGDMVNTFGPVLSDATIENQISRAITKFKKGVIHLDDWVQSAIQPRIDRGIKTHPHKTVDRKKKSRK